MLSHDALAIQMQIFNLSTCFGRSPDTTSCPNRMKCGQRSAAVRSNTAASGSSRQSPHRGPASPSAVNGTALDHARLTTATNRSKDPYAH